jgi:ATP-binding cassette, subfamily B, bacterial
MHGMGHRFGEVPEAYIPLLEQKGIIASEVLACVRYDRDKSRYPCEGLILFTEESLYSVRVGEHIARRKKSLTIKEIEQFSLSEITGVDLYSQLVGGFVVIRHQSQDLVIAGYSNGHQKILHKFKSLLDKKIKGEALNPDDFNYEEEQRICPICQNPYPDPDRKVCPKCIDKRSLFTRVLSYFKPYRLHFIIILVCILVHAGMAAVLPYLSGRILYDQILAPKFEAETIPWFQDRSEFVALMILIAVIFLVRLFQQIFGSIQGRWVAGLVPKAILAMKADIYQSMQKLSVGFFNKRQTGSLLTRIQSDAAEVLSFFIDGMPYLVINIIILVFSVSVMFSLNWMLSIFALIFIPGLFLMSYGMIPKLWHLHGKRHRSVRNMNAAVQDNLTGARVVKAFGREEFEKIRFGGISRAVREAELGEVYYNNKFFGLYTGVETLSALVIWGLGSYLVIHNPDTMTYGMLITFVGYAAMLNGPLDFMSFMFRWWAQSLNSAQRIFEVIDAIPEITEPENPVRKEVLDGDIEVRNLSFSYNPGKPVLENISFRIRAGELFGIVGKTGTGKTTMIHLILRFFDPEEGEILLDGIPIREMAFEDLRKNIAVVSQDTYIFQGSIAQNIAYGRPGCDSEQILYASMASGAHDFICRLPHGYDTIVGPGEKQLSGGERQRISIARAILTHPRILILDEATASIDTLTEQRIQRSLAALTKGRTTISIAHRLSTLKEADRLIVLEEGKIIEEGTHNELIGKKGAFYNLMHLQTKALAIRGTEDL